MNKKNFKKNLVLLSEEDQVDIRNFLKGADELIEKNRMKLTRQVGNIPMDTGRIVDAVRIYKCMTVQQLAELLEEHPVNVYKILNGRRTFTDALAVKIGNVLGIPPMILMCSRIVDAETKRLRKHSDSKKI